MINSYTFGEMFIDGRHCSSNLIIYPEHLVTNWRRRAGHELCLEDIHEILEEQPECLVIGTGKSGLMKILPETEEYLQTHNIELIAEPTAKAYKTFNTLSVQRHVVGAFHLTC